MVQFNNSWDILLKDEFEKPYYLNLRKFLSQEYKTQTIYPHMNDIFNALKYTDYQNVKVVILGQDPYHQPNQAHGLCFSVKKGVNPPPSLQNMYKEIHAEYGYPIPNHGELTYWAEQGVLMLNTVLTVRESQPNSHKGMGWEIFTDDIMSLLNQRPEPMVFLLWGANARAKTKLITNPAHLVLTSAHPSPLSAYNGFFGNNHFKKANEFLKQNGIRTHVLKKIEESDEIFDSIRQGHIAYVINTSNVGSTASQSDGYQIRKYAIESNVTLFSSLDTVKVLLDVLEETTLCISTIDS